MTEQASKHTAVDHSDSWSTTATVGSGDRGQTSDHIGDANGSVCETRVPYAIERWLAESTIESAWSALQSAAGEKEK